MTAISHTESTGRVLRLLSAKDGPLAWRFLANAGSGDVYLASLIWEGALEFRPPDGGPEFHGCFEGPVLRALLYLGTGGLVVTAAPAPADVAAFAPVLRERAHWVRALIAEVAAAEVLLGLLERGGARARLRFDEILMETDATSLDPAARAPEMRVAEITDLDEVARVSRAAHQEEIGDDPVWHGADAFVGRTARQILHNRVFVWTENGDLAMKAELSALCPLGAQISGVYTEPAFRGRGFARRGTGEVAHRALAEAARVCLFVREGNQPARRAYERAGFRPCGRYRTVFFEDSKRRRAAAVSLA